LDVEKYRKLCKMILDVSKSCKNEAEKFAFQEGIILFLLRNTTNSMSELLGVLSEIQHFCVHTVIPLEELERHTHKLVRFLFKQEEVVNLTKGE